MAMPLSRGPVLDDFLEEAQLNGLFRVGKRHLERLEEILRDVFKPAFQRREDHLWACQQLVSIVVEPEVAFGLTQLFKSQ
jgi:hypothetical protein